MRTVANIIFALFGETNGQLVFTVDCFTNQFFAYRHQTLQAFARRHCNGSEDGGWNPVHAVVFADFLDPCRWFPLSYHFP